ncbi:MAG: trigger factor [Porphyromonas sp.]|nr:trigger factor [Porphyromonas sp.]
MAVTINNTSAVALELVVRVTKADYQPAVEKALKGVRKNADFPGFRKGQAPMSFVVKKFGMAVKLDEINKLVVNELYNEIESKQLCVLGEPIPVEGQNVADLEAGDEFEFKYEVALAPELKVELTKEDTIPYYRIEAEESMIDAHIEQMLAQHGERKEVESVEERDLVRGVLTELEGDAPKAEGVVNEHAMLLPMYIKDEESRAKFVGAAKDSVVVFEPFKAYEGNSAELVSFLGVDKDAVASYEGVSFSFRIDSISRHVPAELNEAFFTAAFGEEGDVKDEATLREQVKAGFREQFDPESDYLFVVDTRKAILAKAGKIEVAEDILKRWLRASNKELSAEQVEAEFPAMLEDLTYQLVKDGILAKNDVKITEEEVLAFATIVAKSQFAQYGMSSVPDEMLEGYAKQLVSKEETARNIRARLIDNKFAAIVKGMVTVDEKSVTPEEFGKVVRGEEA